VWVQQHQPVPVQFHDDLRQPAPVLGRQGLRCMLPGMRAMAREGTLIRLIYLLLGQIR
jgi:hypothetical protein